jgi:hypothetical protein
MTISTINSSFARPRTTAADVTSSAAASARASAGAPVFQADEPYKQPTPPRFPWFSRLAEKLEAASNQRAAFPAAPVLGDHLDKSA